MGAVPAATSTSSGTGEAYLSRRLQQASPGEIPASGASPFGTVLGFGPLSVPAYSSDYASADKTQFPDWDSFQHKEGDVFYGFKWQCVEYARRWLIKALGITFGSIDYAWQIFDLPTASRVAGGEAVPWLAVPNGGPGLRRPQMGSVLIWHEQLGGYYNETGHVAIVTEASDTFVRVAEQNIDDVPWPPGRSWSRELPVTWDATSDSYTIHDPADGQGVPVVPLSVRGWMMLRDLEWGSLVDERLPATNG
jgi:glutathionylspermidine amidase/synthetase